MERQQRIRIEALENDLRRRQTSYIRRERAYKSKIEELERQLTIARRGGGSDETESKMISIRATHEKIIENIEKMQSTTAQLMKEQEADLLRQFRVRLFDVQEELEAAKAKANDENASVWIKKYRALEKEMEWVKALADKLEQSNKNYVKENSRLHLNFKSQEDDRSMLVKQLVLVKKDNARLRQEIQELKEKVTNSFRQPFCQTSIDGGLTMLIASLLFERPYVGKRSSTECANIACETESARDDQRSPHSN